MVQGLKEAGVDFTAGVPDSQFIQVIRMMAKTIRTFVMWGRRMKRKP